MKFPLPPQSIPPAGEDYVKISPVLLRAIEKIIRFGEQVGVGPDEMISLLDSGVCISDLLAFLTSRPS
jgi:hypothetical protein